MNGMCTFLNDLKIVLSRPEFYSSIYPDIVKIIEENGFTKNKSSAQTRIYFTSSYGKGEVSLKLTEEHIEFEKEQVKNRDEIKFKNLMKELSKVPCERRMYNFGHYFDDSETGFCSFCKRHVYGIKDTYEKNKILEENDNQG